MNVMFDLTQFCITSLLPEKKTSALLAKLFMENVILTFGMITAIVIDAEKKNSENVPSYIQNHEATCLTIGKRQPKNQWRSTISLIPE